MRTTEFRETLKVLRYGARKQKGLEVYDITENGKTVCKVAWSELYHLATSSDVVTLLEKRIRRAS